MAKNDPIAEIKKYLEEKRLVLGQEEVVKALRNKKLAKVYLARNCADLTKRQMERYGQLANVPIETIEKSNEELGILCKKPFFVSVLGVSA